jgi:hypothetical protein
LAVDPSDGSTKIKDEPLVEQQDGMSVWINLGEDSQPEDGLHAEEAIYAADKGALYNGASSPWWYGPRDLQILLNAAPANATAGDVLADLGWNRRDERLAESLTYEDCKTTLEWLCITHAPMPSEKLGRLGQDAYGYEGYGCKPGQMTTSAGAQVPYVIEVWADAEASKKKGMPGVEVTLFVNRTRALAPLHATAVVDGGI